MAVTLSGTKGPSPSRIQILRFAQNDRWLNRRSIRYPFANHRAKYFALAWFKNRSAPYWFIAFKQLGARPQTISERQLRVKRLDQLLCTQPNGALEVRRGAPRQSIALGKRVRHNNAVRDPRGRARRPMIRARRSADARVLENWCNSK
jgi:hypothetical protein